MKKQIKKFLAILLTCALLASLAACGGSGGSSGESSKSESTGSTSSTGSTASTEEEGGDSGVIELTGFAGEGPYTKGEFSDLAIFKLAEEATGVRVNFESAPAESFQEKLSLRFASNNIPDVFFKCNIPAADITKYTAEGTFVPLDELMAENAPNFSKYMADDVSIAKNIRQSDGKIYGFPYLVTASPSRLNPKLFINKKWMDAQKLEMPATTDELYELLKQMKDFDYNGNGEADEVPLTADFDDALMNALYGSFGLLTRGSAQSMWDVDPDTNELRCVKTSDSYKEMLQYLNKLYSEKLLDQEYFTSDIAALTAKAQQNICGVVFCYNTNYLGDYKDDFTYIPAPLTGPGGDQLYSARTIPVAGQNTFVTKNNQHPAETVKWIDWFYSDEGIEHYFMGVEGETYEFDSEGHPQFTDFVANNPDGLNMEEALGSYVCWSGGANPSVADDLHFGNHLIPETTVKAAEALMPYTPEEIWGVFNYSAEDTARLSELTTDIDGYVDEMTARFITGEESFDKWEDYKSRMESMGLSEYREIVQRALDNYEKN